MRFNFSVFVFSELTKLKIQLELPGPTGTITSAVDRKIEEGQRVSLLMCHNNCTIVFAASESLWCQSNIAFFFFFPRTEPASTTSGFTETRGGPAVWRASLLSQHRRGAAAAGVDSCR